MNFKNLHDFVQVLEREGELIRVQAPVSSCLEITEITDRVSKSANGGPALLFENVDESSFPVLINAFGSSRRIALALGTETLEQLGRKVQEIIELDIPKRLADKLRLLGRIAELGMIFPRRARTSHPPCQEIVLRGTDIDLGKLPVLQCWPDDGGPFITLPVVFTKSLISGKRNAGMYRMQIYDRNTTGMHWHTHKDGAHFFREYETAGKRMEVAVAIGTDPVVTYAATAPLPPGIDEMLFAGFIRNKPVRMVRAVTVDLEVPAEAEIILEGYVDPREKRLEGPFGDHTGYYSLPDYYPVFHVTAITHRKNAIYSTTVVGRPPMEDCYLALATERIFLPLIRTIMPEIKDYWLPWEGVFHNLAVVAIRKEYPGQARKVMQGLWGSGQMSFCKTIIVVDEDNRLGKSESFIKDILMKISLQSDILITDGILDALDHSSPTAFFGGKLGIDATRRLESEPDRPTLRPNMSFRSREKTLEFLKALDEGFLSFRQNFGDINLPLLILRIAKSSTKRGRHFRDLLLRQRPFPQGIAVLYDPEVDEEDASLLLWKAFNNVDPQRDICISDSLMIVDATRKSELDDHHRPWPDDLIIGTNIKKRIDSNWETFGIPLTSASR